jgi:DNA-binding LacI/PurR family transcriptional regulator
MGIRRLARALDLSIGTVSRALNDRPDVNDATRARVKAAAAAAGYVANQSGRSLRKGCTGIVAAVIPTAGFVPSSEATFFKVLEGARRTLIAEGVDLVVLFRGPDEDQLDNLKRIVSRRIADGIVITQTSPDDPRIAYLAAADVKFVAFGRSAGCAGYAWVDFDFEAAATEAVRCFVEAGHRRIALVTSEHAANYNDLMRASFAAEAERRGLAPEATLLIDSRAGRLTVAGRATLADPRRAPTAFLAGNERIAAGLYADLAALGRPAGEVAAVISATPALDPDARSPALTSFETDLDEVGCMLAAQLLAVLPGVEPRSAPPLAPAPTRLVLRASHLLRTCERRVIGAAEAMVAPG